MKPLNIQLSPEEVNKVLTALGNLPYVQVYELIEKVKQQAEDQFMNKQNGKKTAIEKEFTDN